MIAPDPIQHVPGGSVYVEPETGLGHCTLCDWRGVPTPGQEMDCPACYESQQTQAAYEEVGKPRRVEADPGRNDPCFCGSGKKYKKCHGR